MVAVAERDHRVRAASGHRHVLGLPVEQLAEEFLRLARVVRHVIEPQNLPVGILVIAAS
jgi:hypothetical protein